MTEHAVERATASEAEWWLDEPAPKVRDTYDPEQGLTALEYLAESLEQVRDALAVQDYVLTDATRYLVEAADVQALVATVAMLQDLKRSLAVAEAYVAREVGYLTQEFSSDKTGRLPDGRPYEILRGSVRKAWDHDAWKDDVAAAAVRQVLGHDAAELVDPDDGTVVSPYDLIRAAQAAHGSTAPKSTALKALGLKADDYCESSPGPYTVKITKGDTA